MNDDFRFYVIVDDESRSIIGTERVDARNDVENDADCGLYRIPEEIYQAVEHKMSLGYRFTLTSAGDIVEQRDVTTFRSLAVNYVHTVAKEYANIVCIVVDDHTVKLNATELALLPICLAANVKMTFVRGDLCHELRSARIPVVLADALKKRNAVNVASVECITDVYKLQTESDILKRVNVAFRRYVEDELGVTIDKVLE